MGLITTIILFLDSAIICMYFLAIFFFQYVFGVLFVSLMMYLFYLLQCLGSPVLGYLTAVILIGPYGLSIIHHVHETKATAEFEVVFLMFKIGLELSVERLSSMKKYVFGLGSAQECNLYELRKNRETFLQS